jgi:hypothetical protein
VPQPNEIIKHFQPSLIQLVTYKQLQTKVGIHPFGELFSFSALFAIAFVITRWVCYNFCASLAAPYPRRITHGNYNQKIQKL